MTAHIWPFPYPRTVMYNNPDITSAGMVYATMHDTRLPLAERM
jgi:hypothetical protein